MMDKSTFDINEIYLLIEDLLERVKKLEEEFNANQSKEVRDG
tara:strand:+ start:1116 stop:1241 length:126 start_codon:yes stop_codon:yes gene_type:complete